MVCVGSKAVPADRRGRLTSGLSVVIATGLWLGLIAVCSGGQSAVRIGGHFALSTLAGEAVTEQNFAGRWQLIYFGFTYCPDACPTVLTQVRAALEDLGALADQVQPLFITVDPERDSADRLKDYLAHFDARIVGLRGTPQQTAEAAKAYRVYFKARPVTPGGDAYTIDHSSFLFLMKPDGTFAQLLQTDTSSHRLADELRKQLELQ